MATKVDTNYQVKKGESRADYDKRVAAYNKSKSGTTSTSTSSPVQDDPFISELQKRLMKQSDVISSSSTGIESKINEAISGLETASDKSTQRLESQFGREKVKIEEHGKTALTDFAESRSGFGTQMVALRNLVKTTDDNLNDLETRKQEAILMGESMVAGQIAELQLQSLQYRQQAEQSVFNNLLSQANFGLSARQDARSQESLNLQKQQQSFTERSALANIGLEFGVSVTSDDTLETMMAKVAPFASEKRKLEMQKMAADLRLANAQADNALNGGAGSITPDAAVLIADTIMKTDPAAFLKLDPEVQSIVAPYFTTLKANQKSELEGVADSMDKEEFVAYVQDPNGPVYDNGVITEVLTSKYLGNKDQEVKVGGSSLPGLLKDAAVGYSEGIQRANEWLTGVKRSR